MTLTLTLPENETPDVAPETDLIDTYLQLIDAHNRRIAAYEAAMEAEQMHLAELPAQIIDLTNRLMAETDPALVNILRAKLDEARLELTQVQRQVAKSTANWPARSDQMRADIARFEAKLQMLGYSRG